MDYIQLSQLVLKTHFSEYSFQKDALNNLRGFCIEDVERAIDGGSVQPIKGYHTRIKQVPSVTL